MKRRIVAGGVLGVAALLTLVVAQGLAQQSLRVRVERWISIRQVSGTVTYQRGNQSQLAQVGDRLQAVGDGITTAGQSAATLAVDTGIGFIDVAENTRLRIQTLEYAPDNGRVTRLQVSGGQVRLRLRSFTHRGSELEIQTPAGLSGVRGTEFGVNVQPNGKTGLATRRGKVVTSARGQTQAIPAGFQNFTIPGEPPSIPVPLRNDTRLQYRFERVIEGSVRKVRLIGQVDPVNGVAVDGKPQVTDRNGRFNLLLLLPSRLRLSVTVTTPLGKQEVYDLAL